MSRTSCGATGLLLFAACLWAAQAPAVGGERASAQRPNILWITCEDLSCLLGCYGDQHAVTPNIDRLARHGVRYTLAFANAPCCSPARSCLITGVYPSSLGTMHLRSVLPMPDSVRPFTERLRKAGYYCTNNVKEDYQCKTWPSTWDQSSGKAHWRGRAEGQPFFAVFNLMATHQSRVRFGRERFLGATADVRPGQRHDPNEVPLPPYYPDTPDVRRIVANLYDLTTEMDYQTGQLLKQLEEDGLAEETIVFFYSDHGSGIPRGKRWLHDTGLQVPMILRFPERYAHLAPSEPGTTTDRLVSFVDFAPTVLSLLGLEIPACMQGGAFLGPQAAEPRETIFGSRDRVDEVYELSRCVRDRRFKYIRNYYPQRPRMPYSTYSERSPIRREFRRLAAEGTLQGQAAEMMLPTKPVEELYDTRADPWELNNLADDPRYGETLAGLRAKLIDWMLRRRDLAFLPESEMYSRCDQGETPYDMGRNPATYPCGRVLETAEMTGRGVAFLDPLVTRLDDEDSAVRLWAVRGLHAMGPPAAPAESKVAELAADDPSQNVRIAAAELLVDLDWGDSGPPLNSLAHLLRHDDPWIALNAASTLKRLSPKSLAVEDEIREALPSQRKHFSTMFHDWALQHALRRMGHDIPNTD